MTSPLLLFCDENIPRETVLHLRNLGYDVSSVQEIGMAGARDEEVLAKAVSEHRCLVTFNEDFSDLRWISSIEHHGIIRLRTKLQTVETLNPLMEQVLARISEKPLANTLVTVKSKSIRFRSLD